MACVAVDPLNPSFDREQEGAVERLREQYAAGAFSLDELTTRVARAYAARTSAELADALADLAVHPVARLGAAGSALAPHLTRNEQVLWVGRPDPRKHFCRADAFAIPFSLLWGGFAIFWEAGALAAGPAFFALWGIPFLAVALYMIGGRFAYKARLKRRTIYAVTSKRVLKLVRRGRGDALDAAFIDALPAVNRDLGRDGSGSVVFGGGSLWQAQIANTGVPLFTFSNFQVPLAFYDLPDAAHVADLVTELRRAGTSE